MAFKGFFQKILTSIIRSFAPPRRSMRALSRTGCWPHEVPPGAWLLANAAAHRRTPGFHRGRAGSSGSDCQERRSPPGPWLLANAAAYRRTSGLRRGARARSGIRLRRSSPPGSWVLASAAAHRRTSGLRRGAQARSGIRLQATRSPTGLLGVGKCCSSSSDARRSPRGMRARPGSGGQRRRSPPGSLVLANAAAHQRTPGAPRRGVPVLPDPTARNADPHRAPGCWPMLQLIDGHRALPPRHAGSAGIRLRPHGSPPGAWLLANAEPINGPSAPRRAMLARSGSGCQRRKSPPGLLVLANAAAHRRGPGTPRPAAGSSEFGCWQRKCPPGLLVVGQCCSSSTARVLPPRHAGSVRNPSASDAGLHPGPWL